MKYTEANHWFWKINANAIGMINQRICMKKHNPHFRKIFSEKNFGDLKPTLKIYRSPFRNKMKTQTPFITERSRYAFRIRKFTRLKNKK